MICICGDGRINIDASQKTGLPRHLIVVIMLSRVAETVTEPDEDHSQIISCFAVSFCWANRALEFYFIAHDGIFSQKVLLPLLSFENGSKRKNLQTIVSY
jgi:hypothetical protein